MAQPVHMWHKGPLPDYLQQRGQVAPQPHPQQQQAQRKKAGVRVPAPAPVPGSIWQGPFQKAAAQRAAQQPNAALQQQQQELLRIQQQQMQLLQQQVQVPAPHPDAPAHNASERGRGRRPQVQGTAKDLPPPAPSIPIKGAAPPPPATAPPSVPIKGAAPPPSSSSPQPQTVPSKTIPVPAPTQGGLSDLLGGSDDEDDDDFFDVETSPGMDAAEARVPQVRSAAASLPPPPPPPVAAASVSGSSGHSAAGISSARPAVVPAQAHSDPTNSRSLPPRAPGRVASLSPRLLSLSPRQQRATQKPVVYLSSFQPDLHRARQPPTEAFGKPVERGRASSTFASNVKRGCAWLDLSEKKKHEEQQQQKQPLHPGRVTTSEKLKLPSSFSVKQPDKPHHTFVSSVPRPCFIEKERSYILQKAPPTTLEARRHQQAVVERLYRKKIGGVDS